MTKQTHNDLSRRERQIVEAAFGLGQLRDRRAVEALFIALKDSNEAAWAIGR